MNIQEVEKVFEQHWQIGWGSISASETLYIQDLIARHAPHEFLEIGMASGISGGLIAAILEENGGGAFTSIDHDNSFFGDPSKENGFLIEKIYQGTRVTIEKLPFKTSVNLQEINKHYDMAFIDANHQHPWPLLDTLCLYPFMKGSKIVIHHDLNLYKKQRVVYGIGPKYLYDQFPATRKDRYAADLGNIFSIDLNIDRATMEEIAIDTVLLPWSLRTPLSKTQLDGFRRTLSCHYSEDLLTVFEEATKRFNYRYSPQQEVVAEEANPHSSSWLTGLLRRGAKG